jgi:hypothetical protein
VGIEDKFCVNCGAEVKIVYSEDQFFDVYNFISEGHNSIDENNRLSSSYVKYIKENYKEDKHNFFMRSASIIGYNIRLSEKFFGKLKNKKLPSEISDITTFNHENICKIVRYFERNRETIIPSADFFRSYSVIDSMESASNFIFIVENYIELIKSKDHKIPNEIREAIFLNATDGYTFKTTEDILNC